MKLDELYEVLLKGRPQHRPWSLCEARVPTTYFNDLLAWAASLSSSDIDLHMKISPIEFGSVLMWLEAEVARRYSDEGKLWSVISDGRVIQWQPHARGRLFTQNGQPSTPHKELLTKVANRLEVRNAFDAEEAHRWYRLLYLQFGFTHSDAKQRLHAWLSGQGLPVSVDTLLKDKDHGAREFQGLWRSLHQLRLGNVSPESTRQRLKESCWVLPEWCDDLLAAAKASKIIVYDGEDENPEAFFTAPRLSWGAAASPWFETELCNLGNLGLIDQCYEVKLRDEVVCRLFRQADGSYISDIEGKIIIGSSKNLRAQTDLSLVSVNGPIVRHSPVCLWDPNNDVNLFRPSDGMAVEAPALKMGQAFDVIASTDLKFEPNADYSFELDQGYCFHRFKSGWKTPIVARLDDFVLWSSKEFGMPAQPIPYDIILARWTGGFKLDFRVPSRVKDAPWEVPLEIQIVDQTWKLRGLRWTRSDGQLMKWDKAPSYLKLVERDVVKPVMLRAIVSNGSRTVTIPLELTVPLIGCFRWSSQGRPSCQDSSRSLSVGDAKRVLWSFYLPPNDNASGLLSETNTIHSSLMEGDSVRGRLRRRPGVMPILAGYGAPAYVSTDPYNSDQHILELSTTVIDGGLLGHVMFQGEMASVERKSNFEFGEDHQLFAWFSSEAKPGQLVKFELKNIVQIDNKFNFPVPEDSWVAALVLLFRGERLGSWFDNLKWSSLIFSQNEVEPRVVAALLRCWKAPMLQSEDENNHRDRLIKWLREHWQDALPVWLLPKGEVIEYAEFSFTMPSPDEHWLEAVNTLLCELQPTPNAANFNHFINNLTPNFKSPSLEQRVGRAVMELVRICPLLAAKTLRTCLQNFKWVLPNKGRDLLNQLIYLFPSTDEKAEELAQNHGNRDAIWLKSSVSALSDLDTNNLILSSIYRKLAKNANYRNFALGVWLREIQRNFRL